MSVLAGATPHSLILFSISWVLFSLCMQRSIVGYPVWMYLFPPSFFHLCRLMPYLLLDGLPN
ncbi:MAG: hypothetical protein N6V49_09165 [Serratia symbiotica]|nr:hypothetical protein [Serratia symbiotica]